MPKNKSLSVVEMSQLKEAVMNGEPPVDLSKRFNVGISTIHNYKTKFKQEGAVFPSVRGRRVTTGQLKNEHKITPVKTTNSILNQHNNTFIVNGIPISITSTAKSVNINNTSNGIVFEIKI